MIGIEKSTQLIRVIINGPSGYSSVFTIRGLMKNFKKEDLFPNFPLQQIWVLKKRLNILTQKDWHIMIMPSSGGALIAVRFVQTRKFLMTVLMKNADTGLREEI